MKAYCVVAHPDDCVIFARPYIDSHPEYNWTVVYLTYNATDPRAQEVAAYWNSKGIDTKFLGFKDDYVDQQTQVLNFWDESTARLTIYNECRDADLILTHNADGDYGHIHHKVVHRAFEFLTMKKVYFASTFNYNVRYMATGNLPLEQFPLHRDVIEQFSNIDCGLYIE